MTIITTARSPITPERGPLSYPDFRLYWFARFTAVMATMAMVVILGYQVYDLARSDYGMSIREASFQLGLLGLIQFVPLAILTPVAGWVADRFERRRVVQIADLVDLCVALMLAAATWQDALTLPILFGLAAAHGAARAFVGPAMSAIAPNIVPAAVLPKAIAMSAIAWQSASVIGPAVGGLLYAQNASAPHWFAAALLTLSMTALQFIRPVHPPPTDKAVHPIKQMAEGLRYTVRERFLLGAITLDLFAVILAGATALLPVFARDILHVGAEGLGLLRSAPALGSSALALYFAFRPLKYNVGVKMLWAVIVFGVATIGFGVAHIIGLALFDNAIWQIRIPWLATVNINSSFAIALFMLVILGAADMLSVYVRSSLVQLNTPDDMRGRVSAVSGLAISASNELGEMQSGIASAFLGPVGAVVLGGLGAIGVTAIWAWLFPELRNARTFEPQFRDKSQ